MIFLGKEIEFYLSGKYYKKMQNNTKFFSAANIRKNEKNPFSKKNSPNWPNEEEFAQIFQKMEQAENERKTMSEEFLKLGVKKDLEDLSRQELSKDFTIHNW